jgi:uncharacterized protein YbjT (DUF2867 family)
MPASLDGKIITIFGGTGFVGRSIIAKLAKEGALVRVVTRSPQSAYFLKPYGRVGQISSISCDFQNLESVQNTIEQSYAVINCLGILFEKGTHTFQKIHADYIEMIAQAARQADAEKLIHISALACDRAQSQYAISKKQGEDRLLVKFPSAIILRPSVIFGADDNFFNMFAKLSTISPFLPLIGGGHTLFQPVYVGDVAQSVINALLFGKEGSVYELGGSEIISFKGIMEKLKFHTGRKRYLMPIPVWFANIQATIFSLLPTPLLTKDQIISLETDNVVSSGALTLKDLNITPKVMDEILPTYLGHFKSGGPFADKKRT